MEHKFPCLEISHRILYDLNTQNLTLLTKKSPGYITNKFTWLYLAIEAIKPMEATEAPESFPPKGKV